MCCVSACALCLLVRVFVSLGVFYCGFVLVRLCVLLFVCVCQCVGVFVRLCVCLDDCVCTCVSRSTCVFGSFVCLYMCG